MFYCTRCDRIVDTDEEDVHIMYEREITRIIIRQTKEMSTNPMKFIQALNNDKIHGEEMKDFAFVYETKRKFFCKKCYQEIQFDAWMKGEKDVEYGIIGYDV